MPGPMQMFMIFLAIVLLFGAKRIPEIAGSVAKGIKEFKKVGSEPDEKEELSENSSTKKSDSDKVDS